MPVWEVTYWVVFLVVTKAIDGIMNLLKKTKYQASGSLSQLAWHRFKKNALAMTALIFIILVVVISILGYVIIPDKTPFANNQMLELATKKPGFKVNTLERKLNRIIPQHTVIYEAIYGQPNDYQELAIYNYSIKGDSIFIEEYTGMTPNDGLKKAFHLADVAFALNNDKRIKKINDSTFIVPTQQNGNIKITRSSLVAKVVDQLKQEYYRLGTDRFGRDYLSQLIIGARVSLSVGFIAVLISLIVGITLGATAAFFGGWIDQIIVWFINVVWSIPTLLLVIAITMALGKGYWQVFIAVGLTMWVEVARVVRGQVLSIRQKEFVEAGTALGYSNGRIIFKHILPNVVSPLIVISAANFAAAILIEAGLSFLGIGVQPPTPSWGIMIKEHYGYIILDYAYLALLPGIAIMLMVLAFMIVGNGLRDALDVKMVK